MNFLSGEGWMLTILVLDSFQMLIFFLNVYYVPNRFTAFVVHMLDFRFLRFIDLFYVVPSSSVKLP